MKNFLKYTVVILVILGTTNLLSAQMNTTMAMDTSRKTHKAICVLTATQGNNVTGTITFTQTPEGIKVVADVVGLTKGKHGFHIHECGDCSAADGLSAGGHFNPNKTSHGAPMDIMHHAGDMGNIEADDSGKAHLEYVDTSISLEGATSVIGRSVIIHKNEDDMKTQPTGNAGSRVACGVIGIGK